MDQRLGQQHLSLSRAAGVVYQQIAGIAAGVKNADEMEDILDRAAVAISNVAPIYVRDEASGVQRQLAPIELLQSRFERGATVLVMKDGTEHRELSVRSIDLRMTVDILKRAGIRFG
ncbi:MAG: hypothetical protein M3544_14870 [Pseudomonadota bacterium]|nr:hypothetical protein [Pseudomonadota bacterium]